ncbi:BTAD domain-containing putative transcriptional regulator [Streptomyces sp. NBC_00878]|uniref:BTAD domain-containing putative transcriptional regulator n=1 Tax=Streptomyces sp. NBC_00878 TaxID=2975854 RepID=UPI00225B2E30|nr:BTAD domain-containing putative transcriptional regulator [Streptomyces sp. NBC_00878]MCX4911140.1 winged helix-turn-helix domain-containing protein [Streptomyces sp. NBC_00878]
MGQVGAPLTSGRTQGMDGRTALGRAMHRTRHIAGTGRSRTGFTHPRNRFGRGSGAAARTAVLKKHMHFRLLGHLEVIASDGSPIDFSGPLGRAITARLILAEGRPVQSETLIDELWGERAARNPANALQVQMTKLRTSFAARGEEGRLVTQAGGYQLILSEHDRNDVAEFEDRIRRGREKLRERNYSEAEELLRDALALWRGPALEDMSGLFFDAARARLEELRLTAHEDAVTAGMEWGKAEELVAELSQLVAAHPLRERPRSQLMLALYRCGRQAEALDVFHNGRNLLDSELGLAPSPELGALHMAILSQDPALKGPGEVSGSPQAPRATEGNLTVPPGAFVGRVGMMRSLREEIGRQRLVTAVGPGGVGKTRLTLEALSQPGNGAGVWWIDLVTVGKGGVLSALAAALGLSESSVTADQHPLNPLERIVSYLKERTAILAFDNCEHLLDETALLVKKLLATCPSTTIVATSREPLSTSGEVLFPVEPMAAEEAAQLFALRASMINPSFDRSAAEDHEVIELCRRLDGLPLAVELAAAHVRLLSVSEIDRRLNDRFALLVKGERTAPRRHRTLRAVLDWSYTLLSTSEQLVLGELALRVAGCSIEDAEKAGLPQSASDSESESEPALEPESESESASKEAADVLLVLGQLVDKSLIFTVRTPGGTRFQMLETVREYALAKLEAEGNLPPAQARFIAWSLGFVRQGHKGMPSPEQAYWSRRVAAESANLRVASELMTHTGRVTDALRLESTLGYFWYILGREEEGIDRLTRTLDAYDAAMRTSVDHRRPTPEEEWALCYVFVWQAWLNHVSGRHDMALKYEERYTDTWRSASNPDLAVVGPVWDALHARLAAEEGWQARFAAADAGIAGTEFGWDRVALHYAWSTYCLHAGDADAAREHALTGIEVSKAVDDPITLSVCLTACGDAEESVGRREAARALWSEASGVLRSMGARSRWAYRALRLAFLDVGEGLIDSADRRLSEVEKVAAELISYDLGAAVANLRGVVLVGQSRFDEAETVFREVWSSSTSPRNRKAVAGVGLAACVPPSHTERAEGADPHEILLAVGHLTDQVMEPLTRNAVSCLLADITERPHTVPARRYPLHERLSVSPSVLAAFC